MAALIRWANIQPAPVLSLDVPSGVNPGTGQIHEPAVQAAATMTLALPKDGMLRPGVAAHAGVGVHEARRTMARVQRRREDGLLAADDALAGLAQRTHRDQRLRPESVGHDHRGLTRRGAKAREQDLRDRRLGRREGAAQFFALLRGPRLARPDQSARGDQRSAEIMKENNLSDPYDVRKHGGIDLPTMQKWLNFHFSICLDLFGQELSTNAATYYTMGLKGRYEETKIDDDHVLDGASYKVPEIRDGKIVDVEEPALNAINQRLRDDYYTDSQRGVDLLKSVTPANPVGVFVDLDVSMARTGTRDDDLALRLIDQIHATPHLEFRGFQHYAGHVMHIEGHAARAETSLAQV